MEDLDLYQNLYNENYTDARKNDLIQKVFANKQKSLLYEKSEVIKMANGGVVEDKIYTPYEFLHELLPKVYDRPYVVSDEVGKEYNQKIEQEQKELDEYLNSKLAEYGVNSLYKIDNKVLIEEIEIRRRKLISDKSFITETELVAYLFCHPELHTEHYVKKMPLYDIPFLVGQGVIMIDYDKPNDSYYYVYVYEYLSGNLHKKLARLREKKDRLMELGVLTQEQFDLQERELKKNLPTNAKITKDLDTCLFILPSSKFGNEFYISPEDVMDINMSSTQSFKETFKSWTKTELDLALITKSKTLDAVHLYFTDLEPIGKENERVYADLRKKAFLDGKIVLMEFMNKGLTTNCIQRLELTWNQTYNFYTEPKYYKFPVACHLSNKFKNGKEFTPNESQIQSIQFGKAVGSGLLAYGVGVGKTASAILNVSYAIDNGLCKKPIFIVPNATYEKWKMEMFGGVRTIYEVNYTENDTNLILTFEEKSKADNFAKAVNGKMKVLTEKIYGHISHITNYVDLYNLSESVLLKLKDYTDIEELQIKNISELIIYLKSVPKNYRFDDDEINNNIRQKYDDFEVDNVIRNYNNYINRSFTAWWKMTKNKSLVGYDYSDGREYFANNVAKYNLKQYFDKGIKEYREELPYILGTLKTFPDKTIFLATYEALKHLGLVMQNNTELTDNDSIFGSVFQEISQGDFISDANFDAIKNYEVLFRDSVYGQIKTKIDVSQLGLDYAVFDESHLLKKVITDSKGIPTGDSNREKRKYGFGKGEYPTPLALTGYFLTRYIQENNNGSNVLHLTATPFTNKPAEIFSMLSLSNRKMLEESSFEYMEQFFDVFMDISFELIFGNTGVARKESLLGYRNLPQLRNLIYSMMDYKSGEDANIKRPEKILFPSFQNNIETTLPETPIQDVLFKQIKDYQRGRIDYSELCADAVEELDINELTEDELLDYLEDKGTDTQKEKYELLEKPLNEEDFDALKVIVTKLYEKSNDLNENDISSGSERDSFRVVKGLSLLKAVTLSPFLSMCQKEAGIEPTYTQFIDSSPKLTYTLQCIKSIHDYELENNLVKSGCVIYISVGVNVSFKNKEGKKFKWSEGSFEKIKQYLINRMGYSADEISIVSGGLSPIEKERAKNRFLSGKSTILIGSASISTGIDLQNNASALFLCSFDWNPTDNEQIAGRIHRQGNKFEKIRIIYPMVMNSADPNIFQQLYEKTLRIKNIWDRNDKGNTLDLKDFDVNSLRKGILDEPEDLAVYWREEQTEELETLDVVLDRRLTELRNARQDKENLDFYTPQMKGMIVVIDAYRKDKARKEAKARMDSKIGDAQDEYDNRIVELQELLDEDDDFAPKYSAEKKKAKEKLEKAKDKAKEDVYDFENDPEGRYKYWTYDEIGDGDDLFKMVNRYVTNSDSFYNKLGYSTDLADIYRSWLRDNFPRFQEGKYDMSLPEEEDNVYRYFDYQSNAPQLNANKWKGSYRNFGKIKQNLQILGISFDEIPQAIDLINEEKERIKQELENVRQQLPTKLQEFILAKEERMIIQPTIQQRVDEFASYNHILHEIVPTLSMDKTKAVEVPNEKLPIKPSKKEVEKEIQKAIEKEIEEAVIVEEEAEVEKDADAKLVEDEIDTTDLIDNLKNGLVVRFNFGMKKGKTEVVDIFYEEGEFITYTAYENAKGEILSDEESTFTEKQVIDFYIEHYDKISEEFYDDETEEVEEEVEVEKDADVKLVEDEIDTTDLIDNLKNGLVVRFNFGIKKGNTKLVDIFYEEGKFISYVAFENADGEIVTDEEDSLTEREVIHFYLKNNSKITDEFFDTGEEEDEEEIITSKTKTQTKTKLSKAEVYNQLIEGYELALELETDEEKIKMYNDLIEGYQLALELEN